MSKFGRGTLLGFCAFFCSAAHAFDLSGAWTTDADNCGKIFVVKDHHVSMTRNSDVFGGGFIVEGNQIKGPAKVCKITGRKEEGSVLRLLAACTTDIAVLGTQEVEVKIENDNQITRTFPSFSEMEIRYTRCKL
jgi:hypothetical protein